MIRIYQYGQVSPQEIFSRRESRTDVSAAVADIIAAVRREGDQALRQYAKEFDKAELTEIEVPAAQLDAAVESLDGELLLILQEAADRIRAFHSRQVRSSFVLTQEGGVLLGQRVTPLDRVGLYIPGGTAAYPSSVLMNCIPAKIAGCREIVMVSPPSRGGEDRKSVV